MTIFRDPFCSCVSLIDSYRIFRFRRRRIVGKNCGYTAFDDQVTDESPVGGIIPQYPTPTVKEQEDRTACFDSFGFYDVDRDGGSVLSNRSFRLVDTRIIDSDRLLGAHQYLTGICRAELFDGFAAAGIQCFKETADFTKNVLIVF